MLTPEVSIITANYNCENFLNETVDSILAQSFKNWELIIIDDNSTDNGVEIIKEYMVQNPRIVLLQNDVNLGAAKTRNRGIELAKGRYIAFLDSDDVWNPQKLEKQLAFMQENTVPFTYTSYDLMDENSQMMGEFLVEGKVNYTDLLKTCDIGCLTAMYDTKPLGKTFMPDILKRQDFGLWLKLLKKTEYAYAIEDKLACYRIRKNSISSNKFKAASFQWKIYRDVEKLNIFTSLYYFTRYAYNGVRKYK